MKNKLFNVSVIVLVLVLMTAGNVFGAGGSQSGGGSQSLVTLDVGGFNPVGIVDNTYWAQILKDDLGIQVNLVDRSPEAIARYLASGDLPDVVTIVSNDIGDIETAIKAGMVVNLDDHRASLPNVYANAQGMLQYHRDYMSAGTGSVYSLSSSVSTVSTAYGTNNMGPYMRWDYYKEQGMPEINDIEDFLPLLKKIMDAHPLTEDGQKVYGISIHPQFDSGYNYVQYGHYFSNLLGIANLHLGFLEIDLAANAVRSRLDDNSTYKRALKFFFTANQMGILDPDSVSQTYDTFSAAKHRTGRVIWSTGRDGYGWNTPQREDAGMGYALVPFKNEKILNWGAPNYLGLYVGYAISQKTRNLDKALALVDYLYSFDGLWKLTNGPRGFMWDLNADGEPYITRQGVDIRWNAASFPNGGVRNEGVFRFTNMPGLNQGLKHPVYGRRIDGADWIKMDYEPQVSALVQDWRRVMNANDDVDYFTRNNMLVAAPVAPMEAAPDNIRETDARIGDLVRTQSWQMILARDEAEFDSLWTDMVTRARGMGLDTSMQWWRTAWNRAVAEGSKYMF
jgi:putative aldouronate transport system substrate-binding protein